MVLWLVAHLLGFVEVRVTGGSPERFLNLAVTRGIYFWNVRHRDGGLHLNVGLRSFRALRPVARRAGCRVRVVRRRGLPFFLGRVRRRRALLAGAAAMAALVYVSSSLVWAVEVRGLRTLKEPAVLAALAELGLRPGVWRARVDPKRVAAALPAAVPQVAWASVRLEGTKAVVEVVERTLLAEEDRPDATPGDVVAAKDGLLVRLTVLAGEPAARPGELVRRGQILIRGVINPWGEGEAPPKDAPGPLPVRARGMARARVWYHTYVEQPLVQAVPAPTGAVRVRRYVQVAGARLVLSGGGVPPFRDYRVEEVRLRPPRWRNATFPVEFVQLRYYEVTRRERRLTRAEALARAEAEARRLLRARIPAEAHLVRESVQVVRDEPELIGLRLVMETEEDIARPAAGAGRQERDVGPR